MPLIWDGCDMRKIFDFVLVLILGFSLGYLLRDLILIQDIEKSHTIKLDGIDTYKCWKKIKL